MLKKIHILFISTIWVAIIIMSFSSCSKSRMVKELPVHEVVVIHSWDSVGEEKELFSEVMEHEFIEKNLNVNIHHFYADMVHRPCNVYATEDWPILADSINKIKPEVILLNDDPIMELVLGGYIDDSIFKTTPSVFAGVNTLRRENVKKYPMTGFEDKIDLIRNLEVVSQVTKSKTVIIELDYDSIDSRLREMLFGVLEDSARYVNNYDFNVKHLDDAWLTKYYPGKMVVNFYSAAHPYTNKPEGFSDEIGKENLQKAFQHARETPQLQVKYDIFCNSIIDRARQPQFTCIREQFNSPPRTRFLGGYFTDTRTQVEDQVSYAARILNGERPRDIALGNHRSGYHMDWNSMIAMAHPLSYTEYKKTNSANPSFDIINAPIELEKPLLLVFYILLGILFSGAIIHFFVQYLSGWKRKGQTALIEELQHEEKVHDLVFASHKDTLWHLQDGVVIVGQQFAEYMKLPSNQIPLNEFKKMVHPDSKQTLDFMLKYREQRGKKTVRLRTSPDGGNTWNWWEISYTANDETARTGDMYGLLLNIDHNKEIEETLEQAQILASQVALKENFLANISHDLRTPLGAVTGFSTLLAMPGMPLEEEERNEYRDIIHQNTEMILNMIDSVMQKAQIETGDLEIIQKPVLISKLMSETFQTNRIIAPTHLEFKYETDTPDCTVNIDLTRTKQVVNNFLSNAFKFTTEGSVTLGWRNIPNTDQVEVYVQDTGIGIDKDKVSQVFDRYVKLNETDRGTGLGLNISKTIINKQGGEIGVESTYGKGSKFFFRLTKYVECLILILTMGIGMLSFSSCTSGHAPALKANVIVVHSYDKTYPPYKEFNDNIHHTLLRNGIDPTIRHIYLDLENPKNADNTNIPAETYFNFCDSLKNSGWEADIFLAEGDRSAHFLLSIKDDKLDNKAKELPIVLGALHHPEWDMIRKHKNMVAINDPIDYIANINLAVEMSGKNVVEIELDHFHQDSLIRSEMNQVISRPPFINNSDYHLHDIRHDKFGNEWKDSVVVLFYSTESPELNSDSTITIEQGYSKLATIYTHSWQYPSLALKRDMYSSAIADKTGKPQFTAVKAGFSDGEARYLCGYFASYATVATDLATTGAKIIKGTKTTDLVGLTHEKHYYMDFDAMQAWGLEYNDMADRFIIVNAPLKCTAPVAYYGTIILIIVVIIGGIFAVILIAQSWRQDSITKLLADIKRRSEMRHLALHGAESRNVRTEDNVKEIISHIHPNYSSNIPLMMQSIEVAGMHSYDIFADIDTAGSYHWWQLRFVVMFTGNKKRVDGILINIDDAMRHEEDLRLAMKLAEEAKQKEDFLTTISHEIRTPLNAVVGFSDVMVSLPKESLDDAELAVYEKIIKTNNATLTTMIEDILMFSRIESGRIKYVNEEFNITDLITELASEWEGIMPDGVTMNTFSINPKLVMTGDRTRIKYILNQMVSNSVKYTTHGAVIIGLNYHLNDGVAELYVGDSGCGIPPEKHSMVFNLFWKDNEFVPGLGLGLNVAKKLADGMGLDISLESKVDYGSIFYLRGEAYIKHIESKHVLQ